MLLVARVVKRSGKASIVVFLLAMVIGIGAILTAIFGGRDAILVRSLLLRSVGPCMCLACMGSKLSAQRGTRCLCQSHPLLLWLQYYIGVNN